MMNQTTVTKLHEMRLSGMAESYSQQNENSELASLSFDDRFGMIVEHEWSRRRSNHLAQLIRKAGFIFPNAAIEDVDYRKDRKLDKSLIQCPRSPIQPSMSAASGQHRHHIRALPQKPVQAPEKDI